MLKLRLKPAGTPPRGHFYSRNREGSMPKEMLRGSREIADALGVHPQTVLRMLHAGELPAFILAGQLTISRATLRAWVRAQEKQAQSVALEAKARMAQRVRAADFEKSSKALDKVLGIE